MLENLPLAKLKYIIKFTTNCWTCKLSDSHDKIKKTFVFMQTETIPSSMETVSWKAHKKLHACIGLYLEICTLYHYSCLREITKKTTTTTKERSPM